MENVTRAFIARLKEPVSGLSHLMGFLISLFAGGVLVGATQEGKGRQLTSLIFVGSMAMVYLASAAYHLVPAGPALEKRLHILDRAAIFVMIAGTSTPFYFYAYAEPLRTQMMVIIWALAAVGVGMKLLWRSAPRLLYVGIYLLMGWIALFRLEETLAGLPPVVFKYLAAGGVAYTLGAIIYALKRPNFSKHFGFHEIWHVFVLLGTAFHYVGIYLLAVG
jgi:hemolysin III